MDYDVVVVGAGPAGSTTARDLSCQGVGVLLLEEHNQVGLPTHCAGLVTPRTLEAVGGRRELVLNEIKGACIHSPSGRSLTLGGDKVRALVVDRARLDQALAQQALERGTFLELGARAVGLERVNHHVRLHLQRRGRTSYMDTQLVIGADGSRSVVAGRTGSARGPEAVALMGAEVATRHLDKEMVHVYLGSDVAPGWFGWLIPLDSHHARIGVGTTEPGHSLKKLLRTFLATRDLLRGARVLHVSGGSVLLTPRQLCSDNIMLVGDAAGQAKPTSGGGIYTGVTAARLCARVAREALERENFTERTLKRYQRQWDALMGPEMALERHVRRLYASLRLAESDALMDVFCRPDFQHLISRYGDIDLQSGLFSRFLTASLVASSLHHLPVTLWPKLAWLALKWKSYHLCRKVMPYQAPSLFPG